MMNEKEKHDMVGTVIECPRDICESGKLFIWGYYPGGNPNHFLNTEEKFNVFDQDDKSNNFEVTLREYESWQSSK